MRYNLYDITEDKIVETGLTFTDIKIKIAECWLENLMQFRKIMRCNNMKMLNSYGEGLGYLIEPVKVMKRKPRNHNYETDVFAYYHKDQYVCDGTVKEISEFTGLSEQRLKRIACDSYKELYKDKVGYQWMEKIEVDE